MHKKKYIIPLFIPHLGCPHDCIFCNQKKIASDILEMDEKRVASQIEEHLQFTAHREYHREVAYYGGSFTGLPWQQQEAFLRPAFKARQAGFIDAIRLSTRPDYITREILIKLKALGVTTIELGVQSTNRQVLEQSHRGHTKEDVDRAVEAIQSMGFSLGLQMMVGLPGDSTEALRKTVADFIQYAPDFVRVYPTLVIKDTGLEESYRIGEYRPLDLEECVVLCKDILISFQQAGIPVIRLGLQTTEEIAPGKSVVAGPFHPALRELVEGEILRERLQQMIDGQSQRPTGHLTIACHLRDVSKVAGYRQGNKRYLMARYGLTGITIQPKEGLKQGELILSWQ